MVDVDKEIPLADLKVQTISQDDFDPKKIKQSPGRPPSSKRKMPLPAWKDGVISSFMTNLYEQLGELIEPYDAPYGYTFKAIAVNAGEAWEACAKDSPTIRRWIHQLMSASKLSKLALAHAPLALMTVHRFGPMRQATDEFAEEFAERMAANDSAAA